jgi:hypothetical protein
MQVQGFRLIIAEINERMLELSKMVKEKQDELKHVKLEVQDAQIKLSVYQIKGCMLNSNILDETIKKLISRVLRYFDRKRIVKEEQLEDMLDCLVKKAQAHFNCQKQEESYVTTPLKENLPFSLEEISNIY